MLSLPKRNRRVLIVEDDDLYYGPILRNLLARGYEVEHARTYEEALVQLYYNHFHVAVIDIWLNDGHGPEPDREHGQGVDLLNFIRKSVLDDVLTRIILTSYPDEEVLGEALASLGVYRYIGKHPRRLRDEDYITRLLRALDEAFDGTMPLDQRQKNRINHNTHLDLEFMLESDAKTFSYTIEHILREEEEKIVASDDYQKIRDLPGIPKSVSPQVLALEIYDLIGELFYEDQRIHLTPLALGLTGAAVLKATPSRKRVGVGQKYVIKIGRRDKIEREYKNYHDYVENRFPVGAVTAVSFCRSRNLGAIRYRFAESEAGGELREFDVLYRNMNLSPEVIANSLRLLFDRTFRLLHGIRIPEIISIPDSYYEAFELNEKGNLKRIVKEIEENHQLAVLLPGFDPTSVAVQVSGLKQIIPNPIEWLNRHADDWGVLTASRGITHGDLTGKNIMADNRSQTEKIDDGTLEYCKLWLIDFYRTGNSHILRDHVILETDIKYRLLDHFSFEEFWLFERILLHLEGVPTNLQQHSPEMFRALVVIQEIHRSARERQGNTTAPDGQIEFLLALLMTTLNVVRLKHISINKKLHAFISASLLCSRIEYLKTGSDTFPLLSVQEKPVANPKIHMNSISASPSYLVEELVQGNLVLFIGRRSGDDPSYPTPYHLMSELMQDIPDYQPSATNTHRMMATMYLQVKPNRQRLIEKHQQYYARHAIPPFFDAVATLPWISIFTTNQHTYLEDIYTNRRLAANVIVDPIEQKNIRQEHPIIYKMYGSLSKPYATKCPLTDRDYLRPQDRERIEAFQKILLQELQLGRGLLMLYPSSSDIATVHNWRLHDEFTDRNLWVVGRNLGQGDVARMGEAKIQYLDVQPTDLLKSMHLIYDQKVD